MGKKAKVTKPLSAIKLPLEEKASAAAKSDLLLSNTSRHVKKKLRASVTVRRSVRLQSPVTQELQPVIEEKVIESANEDEPLLHEQNNFTEETSNENEWSPMKGNPGVANAKYKTMYTRSQIKMEALLEENKQLTKALEHANGKVHVALEHANGKLHVYEKHSGVYSEIMAVIASLSRVNENLSVLMKKPAGDAEDDDK